MSILSSYMSVSHMCVSCSLRLEEGIGSYRSRVIDSWELPCGVLGIEIYICNIQELDLSCHSGIEGSHSDNHNKHLYPSHWYKPPLRAWMRIFSHKFQYLNAWAPADRTVWVGLGKVVFLEKVYHWGRSLRFQNQFHSIGALSLSHYQIVYLILI